MKRLALAIALMLPLAACGGIKDTSATGTVSAGPSQDTVDALTGSLKAAETAAKLYVLLPLCPQKTVCRERGVAAKIGAADNTADAMLKKYRASQATSSDVTAAVADIVALIPTTK